ncbi:TRAP transporter large permease [Sulfitobacter sp. KE34]|uniref:TRAP transporter large permease protein n=1 Tax=Sulfitobacter faviae TaxID=1775881 RepID=A0AAX3LLR7_9RHOB|nr:MULTISPECIES: TRAP transporter large permease [Sulfitobacter]MDF3349283.1 TRAP transporter large permease [Sulfitobacter sp. KE12]MDF3352954.1 TRAP transporter large permease [Sulfitobacter sp. KE27]MDF3356601.1 TRAP transporter large permease [Sulfitobacter sp. KE33]MDF3364025.1 TRAP transporter large permease [Sulfitobacter sp. Ks34]MDF3367634.1 TRAP transporter large permease [Sulfitobacter sp. Ks43]
MELLLILCILLGLIGIGLPIAFALVCIAIGIFWMGDIDQLIVAQRLYRGVQSFPLLAVPLFILAGQIMSRSGISGQLIEFAKTLVGQMRGGLAAVNVVTSMFFAGMSGTSMSDTAAVGGMIIDPMIKRGYSRPFTAAVTAASSTIGIIIPPSVPMVILGAYLGISTGALFAAGLMAGVLLGVALIIVAWIISVREGYPVEAPFSGKRMVVAFGKALPALLMPTIILGGILGGIFTPTEASAVAVVYGIFVGMFYYRTLKLRVLYQTFCEAAVLSGAVMLVTATAHVMGFAFTFEQLADSILAPLAQMDMSPILFLIMLSAIMIIAGTFLDGIAMIFIIVPLFLPAVKLLGIDPIHFGMVVVLCWGIGQQTPPVGAALFITSVIAKVDILTLTRANLPFIAVMFLVLGAVIAFPDQLVLLIPRALGL